VQMTPHVRRRANEILSFMRTDREIRREHTGVLAPVAEGRSVGLVARPAQDGLIHGSMDWSDPTLFLTGVSLLGLEEAADMAARRGDTANPERWRQAAARLREAWRANASGAELSNPRTLMIGLSPTFAAAGLPAFEAALARAWDAARDEHGGFRNRPLWTYFDLAEARQWLMLGRADRAWATLDYFWDNAVHPGLYTLWESDHDEGDFRLWHGVRGWTGPRHVTPHYWTSAEMLLLQAAMLAYVDRTPGREALVIGAGVRPDWISRPMEVRGLATEWGRIDWRWDGQTMRVRAPAGRAIRLGAAFPQTARIAQAAP